ncbi:MAG: aromatic amino acid transaminase [Pseudomonadota bacterium]
MSFDTLTSPPVDALHGVMARFAADPRENKLDLGVGVYRNAEGRSVVMPAVREAERHLLETEDSKRYLGLRGVDAYLDGMRGLLFPDGAPDPYAQVQTVGGTGGIRLAMELAKRANPQARVLLGLPSWPNHATISELVGLELVTYPYFQKATQSLDFEAMISCLEAARRGDVLILHGPCHNPTGADLLDEQLSQVAALMRERGVVPLIDAAYYGMDDPIEDDLARLRTLLDAVGEAYLILSSSKVFSLYRERVGTLFVKTHGEAARDLVQRTLERVARATYSMPPSHGAAAVGIMLGSDALRQSWRADLEAMRHRVRSIREAIDIHAGRIPTLGAVNTQKGIFSLLPLSAEQVDALAKDHAIYMPASGRINVAGLRTQDVEPFCEAVASV